MKSTMIQLAAPALIGVMALSPAHAQEQTTPEPSKQEASTTLETIVVSAQKRSEDVQKVPVSVSVVGGEQLEQMHATQLSDYVGYAAGVQMVTAGTPGTGQIAVRGITSLGTNSTVSTYIDETPLGSSTFFAAAVNNVLDLLPYDVESFQIFRGPQGTLWGAGAFGGVAQYVTRKPELDYTSFRAGTDVFAIDGSHQTGYGVRASANLPLVANRLAASISVAKQYTPGYIDNVTTFERDQNAFTQTAGRLAVRWEPSDTVAVDLSAIKQKSEADNLGYVSVEPQTLKPVYGVTRNDNYTDEYDNRELEYLSGTVTWDVGFADFVSATSYSQTDYDANTDLTATFGPAIPLFTGGAVTDGRSSFLSHLKLYKTTQEFRLASKPSDTFEWIVGGFYTHENSRNYQQITAQFPDSSSIPGLDPLADAELPSTYQETAVFGSVTWKINERFDLSGGVRQARNEQDFAQIIAGALSPPGVMTGESKEDVTTWSLGARWFATDNTMVYARAATGYQPGGPNAAIPGVPTQVDSSTLTNYELGIKSTLLDRRLTFDLAAFNIEWEDLQIRTSANGISYLVNGGKARSRGVELSATYLPAAGLRLGINGAYTDAELTEDVPSIGGLNGDSLPFAPKWSGSVTADYLFPSSGEWSTRVGGGVRYTGERRTAVDHDPSGQPLDDYTALDLNADIANDRWTFRIFVKNLTNENVFVNAVPQASALGGLSTVRAVSLQPRMIGVGVDVKF
ncbi:MAG TPA: TonB-dependent receptor [Pseudoxanthomonas sp.]|nr:TonB-dependent receptor [Pseudoxanthomonas sp.]